MELTIDGATFSTISSESTITDALRSMKEFVVLEERKGTYLQTARDEDTGYVLEYQEQDTDHHYECSDELSLDAIISTFLAYWHGEDGWKTTLGWQKIEI